MRYSLYYKCELQEMIVNTCDKRGIKHVYISKLFYGQFGYKITLAFPLKLLNKAPPTSYYHRMSRDWQLGYASKIKQFQNAREKFLNNLCEICPIEDYEYRCTRTSVTLYTNDEAGLVKFIDAWNEHIIEVASPKSEVIADYMIDHPNILVRDTYFHNRYKYCVVVSYLRKYQDLINRFLISGFGAEPEPLNLDRVTIVSPEIRYVTKTKIYFDSIEDVVLARVALGDCIERIEEIILTEDIKYDAGSIAA